MRNPVRHDALFWRRLAHFGATRGPAWWVRYSPPVFGAAAAALVPSARRAVAASLEQTRGPVGPVRGALDVLRTFTNYAGCLAETLAAGSPNAKDVEATVLGDLNIERALEPRRGLVLVTAHTAGWEIAGPLLSREHGLRVMMAMQAERDAAARALHDSARRANGLDIVHVGSDPLASLALLQHVRGGGAVALQLDRVAPGMRAVDVRLFGRPGRIPEGPLRIAQIARVPVVPIFCARLGFRRYVIDVGAPIEISAVATREDLANAAQALADAMGRFLTRHPTQWLRFEA